MPVLLYVLLAAVTLLMLSPSGNAAAYAAPVTLPILFLIARSSRWVAVALLCAGVGAVTGFEATWVLTFQVMGNTGPWSWLLTILAAVATGAIIVSAHAIHRGADDQLPGRSTEPRRASTLVPANQQRASPNIPPVGRSVRPTVADQMADVRRTSADRAHLR